MSQPTPYVPAYNFADFQSTRPSTPLPAGQVDAELGDISVSIAEICLNLVMIQRDDGAIANQSIGYDQLKSEVLFGVNSASNWVTGHAYITGDGVYENNNLYRCIVSHTSVVFATDLASGFWVLVLDFNGAVMAAAASATAAAASASSAATYAGQANTYQGQAATYATNSANSATAAAASAASLSGTSLLDGLPGATPARGDVPFRSSATWTRLAAGTAGQVFTTKGSGADSIFDWAVHSHAGSFTRDTSLASGTQAITGVGFKPRAVIFLSVVSGTVEMSAGFVDSGLNAGCIAANYAGVSGQFGATASTAADIWLNAGAKSDMGVNSLDADGFTVAHTKTGSMSGTQNTYYLAIG